MGDLCAPYGPVFRTTPETPEHCCTSIVCMLVNGHIFCYPVSSSTPSVHLIIVLPRCSDLCGSSGGGGGPSIRPPTHIPYCPPSSTVVPNTDYLLFRNLSTSCSPTPTTESAFLEPSATVVPVSDESLFPNHTELLFRNLSTLCQVSGCVCCSQTT